MKIRIKGNSIRLRLTKSEVDAFGRDGYVEERTEFGNNLFIYALRRSSDVKELSATFVGIKITMLVPWNIADEWVTTDNVGYSNTFRYSNGKELALLLEKDFKCVDAAVTEDQSDNYENPLISCAPVQQSEATEDRYEHPVNTEVAVNEPAPQAESTEDRREHPANPEITANEPAPQAEATEEHYEQPTDPEAVVSESAPQSEPVPEIKVESHRWSAYEPVATAQYTPERAKEEPVASSNIYYAGHLPTEVKYESNTEAQYTVPEATPEAHQPEEISFFAAPEVVEEQTSDTIEEQPFGFTTPTIDEPVSFTAPEPPVTEVYTETPPSPAVEAPQPEPQVPTPARPSGPLRPPNWR